MHVVYQGETGGYLTFPCDVVAATSGYLYVISRNRATYVFDGVLVSGALTVTKSGVSNLMPGNYTLLPQVVDATNRIYFLDDDDLMIQEVPSFFPNAVLTPASSILVRLANLESITLGYISYLAAEPIQTAKLVAVLDGLAYEADARNIAHAGNVVGVSIESASAGQTVRVITSGPVESPLYRFVANGYGYVGTDGQVVPTIGNDFVFLQGVGVVTSPYHIVIDMGAITLL